MFVKTEAVKRGDSVNIEHLLNGAASVQSVQDGNQTANDHRVALALEVEAGRRAFASDHGADPNLTGTPVHLGCRDPEGLFERRHCAAELDDMAIPVFPVVQEVESFGEFFEVFSGHVYEVSCERGRVQTAAFERQTDGVSVVL